ncbi:MAG: hypothetical protein ACFBSE_17060 [Prochloraceae cyanobacterium]
MFVNVFEVPEMKGIMYIPGRPREYRADCKAGMFKIGESKVTGNELEIEILDCNTFEAELFNYRFQQWLQIIFVDRDNFISHILFKNESLDNFIEMFRELSKDKKALGSGIIKAIMSKRSSETGTYYAVEFSWQENKSERVKELKTFCESNKIYSARFNETLAQAQIPPAEPKKVEQIEEEKVTKPNGKR